jgi:hypothetical protein
MPDNAAELLKARSRKKAANDKPVNLLDKINQQKEDQTLAAVKQKEPAVKQNEPTNRPPQGGYDNRIARQDARPAVSRPAVARPVAQEKVNDQYKPQTFKEMLLAMENQQPKPFGHNNKTESDANTQKEEKVKKVEKTQKEETTQKIESQDAVLNDEKKGQQITKTNNPETKPVKKEKTKVISQNSTAEVQTSKNVTIVEQKVIKNNKPQPAQVRVQYYEEEEEEEEGPPAWLIEQQLQQQMELQKFQLQQQWHQQALAAQQLAAEQQMAAQYAFHFIYLFHEIKFFYVKPEL